MRAIAPGRDKVEFAAATSVAGCWRGDRDAHSSDVFNITEAAVFLGAHEQTVGRLARRGALPRSRCARIGDIVRWAGWSRISAAAHSKQRAAQRALDLVGQETPNLILLDLVMPEMNGIQFLHLLRQTRPELPVVIVTGFPDSELIKRATRYAPVMLLAKPVDLQLLERTIRTVVGDKMSRVARGGAK